MINVDKYKQAFKGFKFIDLFCGLGGFRLSLESMGGKCVFSSDIDKQARKVYKKNYGEFPSGNIREIKSKDIPKHDILCGGFPCQAFSIAGKKLGFKDETRGTLFFEIIRIMKKHRTKIAFLENVANLEKHDNGNTFRIIKKTLNEIGYNVFHKVLNSAYFDLPQQRRRIFIVAVRKDFNIKEFKFTSGVLSRKALADFLISDSEVEDLILNDRLCLDKMKVAKYNNLQAHYHSPLAVGYCGNSPSQCQLVYHINGYSPTLDTWGTTKIFHKRKVRYLHYRECARIMGFPDDFKFLKHRKTTLKQLGNSVAINVIQSICIDIYKQIIKKIK